jgi:hypothetical protein
MNYESVLQVKQKYLAQIQKKTKGFIKAVNEIECIKLVLIFPLFCMLVDGEMFLFRIAQT